MLSIKSVQLKALTSVLFALVLSLVSITLVAQTPPSVDGESSNTEQGENTSEDEEAAEETPEINISDSIPIDSIINSWEEKYVTFMKELGLDSSLTAKFVASGLIILVLLLGIFISKKITTAIRRKLHALAKKIHVSESKLDFYHNALHYLFLGFLLIGALTALTVTWNVDVNKYVSDAFLTDAIANVLTVYLIVIAAALIIDIACGILEKSFAHWSSASQSRVDTLLPIARNTVYISIGTIFTLMLLAEIGINVMPLLAGAGVLGFAIGFGAQTVIKDLLTGFIIILEDLIQVGDVVTLAGCTGRIERITIRKVQLRTLDGTVFTVPFGEITIVGNLTKEFSYAMFEVGIAYRENVDAVSKLLLQLDEELRKDENYSSEIIEPLEILGLDKFADSAVVIKARLKTQPMSQWKIGREFNRRMKMLFDQENVEIPFPHQTIYFGEDKKGHAPPLQLKKVGGDETKEAANEVSNSEDDTRPTNKPKRETAKSGSKANKSKPNSLPDNDHRNGENDDEGETS